MSYLEIITMIKEKIEYYEERKELYKNIGAGNSHIIECSDKLNVLYELLDEIDEKMVIEEYDKDIEK